MLIQKNLKHRLIKSRQISGAVLLVLMMVISISYPVFVKADRFDEQINQLKTENDKKQQQVDALAIEADSLQATIDKLQSQINGLQQQIIENQKKNEELKLKIEEAQKELDKQKKLLGENIKAMYLEGQISTLEMLASSKDLSEFVDKEQYRDAVKTKIKNTLDKVTLLKAQLKSQKEQIEGLLAEQEALRKQVSTQQAQQSRLLNLNQSQQASFNDEISSNKEKIAELKRQQVLENIKLFGGGVQPGIPGGGGYPWGNAYCVHTGTVTNDCYNYDWYFNGSPWDPWGYGFRNCTSWVAYKLAADGKVGFTYLGNAANWPGGAAARGITVTYGSGAQPGNAAVNPNGYYGHVMYVEAVTPDGKVVISDYNRLGDGLYRGPDGGSAAVLSQSGLVFIHF
ncbi:CHAP domain-containing protein [Candidatus Saccharibacteria bacterium]|nr:CHAP domain-containing protein [Candidatus Saccharibacteria bacterium]